MELVYRHNRVTRLTHWINVIALTILFMSGLMIFNAHPNLYWGHDSQPEKAFFSIGAQNEDGDLRGFVKLYGRTIDSTGLFGVQQTGLMPSARAFPSWLTVPGYYSLAAGRRWHFFFGWLFTINGLLYVFYNLAVGHLRKFCFTPADAAKVPAMIAYYLHLRKNSPQEGEYNPLQKMAYTSVLVILTPLILLSGMAMSPQLDVAFNWLPAAFGGRQSARSLHFIFAFSFVFFVFGHVFMVLTQGFFNNMRSMSTGWYREKILFAPKPLESVAPARPDISEALKFEPAANLSLDEAAEKPPPSAPATAPQTVEGDPAAKPPAEEKKHE